MKNGKVLILDTSYRDIECKMEEIFSFLGLDLEGKTVLFKPNLLWPSEPEQGLNTHPRLIDACVKYCEAHGARKVMVGDNAGQVMYGNSKGAFYGSDLGETLGDYYVNLGVNLQKYHLNSVDCDIYISRYLTDADIVINLPKFKTHKLTGITGAIKNTFGYLAGGQKARMHIQATSHERFAELLAELHAIRKPDATITDAILGMQGNGASSKDLRYIGKLLASCDPVAIDSVQANMMGMESNRILHLVSSEKIGLGTMQYETNVPVEALEGFMLAPGFADPSQLRATVTSDGLRADANRMKPKVDPALCVRCGTCVKECPVDCLEMKDKPTLEDYNLCVGCHACMEVCPKGALVLDN